MEFRETDEYIHIDNSDDNSIKEVIALATEGGKIDNLFFTSLFLLILIIIFYSFNFLFLSILSSFFLILINLFFYVITEKDLVIEIKYNKMNSLLIIKTTKDNYLFYLNKKDYSLKVNRFRLLLNYNNLDYSFIFPKSDVREVFFESLNSILEKN